MKFESWENFGANAFAFVMTILLLLFIQQATANDVAPPTFTEKVFVFSRDTSGGWHMRLGTVKSFPNTIPVACFEFPNHVSVQCFYADTHGGDGAALTDVELIGEKKT